MIQQKTHLCFIISLLKSHRQWRARLHIIQEFNPKILQHELRHLTRMTSILLKSIPVQLVLPDIFTNELGTKVYLSLILFSNTHTEFLQFPIGFNSRRCTSSDINQNSGSINYSTFTKTNILQYSRLLSNKTKQKPEK